MKKTIISLICMLVAVTAHAGTWQRPVEVAPVVTYGQPVPGGVSNSVKYVVAAHTPVSAPTDGVLVRSFGLLQTYQSAEGLYWEVFGIFNRAPAASVQAGDYLGYAQSGTVYLLVSAALPPFVNNRYSPAYIKPSGCCLPVEYYNAEGLMGL